MAVKAVRVSKTSLKQWILYGPVDQALKTTCQAEAVKPINLHLDDVHGSPVDLELWVNQEEGHPGIDEPNPAAQMILQNQEMAKQGTTALEALQSGLELPALPVVKGIAVITGQGCTDLVDENLECVLHALLEQ